MLPVFVPLHGHVLTKLEELQQEIEELKQPAPAAAAAVAEAPLPVPPASWPARDGINHPRPPENEQPPKKRRHIDHGRPPAIDMDGDMQVEEKKEVKEERDVQSELAHWFSPATPFLP